MRGSQWAGGPASTPRRGKGYPAYRVHARFLIAASSFCGKQLKLPGNTLVHKELLRKKFEIHCRAVHPKQTAQT
jgi:hypothetical protein